MKKQDADTGTELLYLLRQQRYLYHQFRMLLQRQQQQPLTNSTYQLLETITSRRKLSEKLIQLEKKLRPIKTNWKKLEPQIKSHHKAQVYELAGQVQEIIEEIQAVTPLENAHHIPTSRPWKFNEAFVQQ